MNILLFFALLKLKIVIYDISVSLTYEKKTIPDPLVLSNFSAVYRALFLFATQKGLPWESDNIYAINKVVPRFRCKL